jgi:hypothetical protein
MQPNTPLGPDQVNVIIIIRGVTGNPEQVIIERTAPKGGPREYSQATRARNDDKANQDDQSRRDQFVEKRVHRQVSLASTGK